MPGLIGKRSYIQPADQNWIEFTDDKHRNDMRAVVEQLERHFGVKIVRCDIDKNAAAKKSYVQLVKALGGKYLLPMYYNRKSQSIIYGPTSYEDMKKWADGRRDYRAMPPIYDYMSIRKSSLAYRALGYAATSILERSYTSRTPAYADILVGPLLEVLTRNIFLEREISSVRQLTQKERIFNRGFFNIAKNTCSDVGNMLISVWPTKDLGRNDASFSVGRLLYKINNAIWDRLEK